MRRLREDLEILAGSRGRAQDRAVRLSELTNLKAAALGPILAGVDSRIALAVKKQVATDKNVREAIDDAARKANEVADEVARVETRITDTNTYLDDVLAGLQEDFADVSAEVDALDQAVDDGLATVNADLQAGLTASAQALSDAVTQIGTDLDNINAEIDGLTTSVTDRLNQEVDRITNVQREVQDAWDLITGNAAAIALLGKKVTDAGVYVDEATGQVRIYGVRALEDTVNQVSVDLDAAKASIELRATQVWVNQQIAQASLDPTQVPYLDDLELRISTAEVTISALESAVSLAASQLVVEGMNATLQEVEANLDAANAAISLRATKAEFQEAVARLDAAEAIIDAQLGIILNVQSTVSSYRDFEDFQFDTLQALLDAYRDRTALRETFAAATFQINATVEEGLSAEASSRLQLRADMQNATAALYQENTARATEIEALALSVTGLVSRVDGIDENFASLSYVTQTFYSRAQVDSAIALVETELASELDDIEATLTASYYTKVETDSAIAAASNLLGAEFDGLSSSLATNYFTKAEVNQTIAGITNDLVSRLDDGDERTAEDLAFGNLEAFMNTLNGQREIRSTLAAASQQITTLVVEGVAAEAAARLSLRTEFKESYATLYRENSARASEYEAIAFDILALGSRLDNPEDEGLATVAYLEQTYYTRADVDAAVAAVQTSLSSTIGAVSSTLTTDYYTSASIDAALSSLRQDLESSIGNVSSSLSNNYYTSTQADQAIAAARTSLKAELEGNGGSIYEIGQGLVDVVADIDTNYMTAAETDEALAGIETNLRAVIDRTSPPSDFADDGEHWTRNISGAPADALEPYAAWSFADGIASVSIGSGNGAIIATKGVIAVVDSDTIRVTIRARVNGSGSGADALACRVAWLDGAFSTATIAQNTQNQNAPANEEWDTYIFEAVAPPDAHWARAVVNFFGANLSAGATGDLEVIRIENVTAVAQLAANISQQYYTKAATDEAIAASIQTYDARVDGGMQSKVESTVVALAGLNGSVARLSQIVSTGSGYNAAGIEFFAWDDEGGQGSAVKLLGDHVIVPGTLTAATVLVTDGSGELLPNRNFLLGDLSGWNVVVGNEDHISVFEKTAGAPALQTANAGHAARVKAGVSPVAIMSGPVACKPEDRIAFGVEAAITGAQNGAEITVSIIFFDENDGYAGTWQTVSEDIPNATWRTAEGVAVAPAGTVYFRCRVWAKPSNDRPIYFTNVSALKQRTGALLITPHSIGGAQLITTEALITAEAQIGDATITSAKIKDELRSDNFEPYTGEGTGRGWRLTRDGDAEVESLTVRRAMIVGGATTDFQTETSPGLFDPTKYTGDWRDVLVIELGQTSLGEMWTVIGGGDVRKVAYSTGSGNDRLYGFKAGKLRLLRQVKKYSGSEWTAITRQIGDIQTTSVEDWWDITITEIFGGAYYDVRYILQQDVNTEGNATPPASLVVHRDIYLTAERKVK
ncbi:hypothetical protein JI664_21425 [Rhodobacter sp. NTK016B]|uniref:phage tail tip fiber protein n=1 Tax=Rhodobacter sp. NTK016B TaxID=2759676 RepID=UPI001A8F1699|nr:hypothetical protein [Rhodobacter sp. NTK016B]MBN8294548.1 hypothetical protein [Rhodobacter sp. NTK016B]